MGLESPPHKNVWNQTQSRFIEEEMKLPDSAPSLNPSFWFNGNPLNEKYRERGEARQDYFILMLNHDKANGYYVDLATNIPDEYSNTYVLDLYNNWTGICIEPDPRHHIPILSKRRCSLFTNPVSSVSGEIIKFRFAAIGGTSGIVGNDFDNKGDQFSDVNMETTTLTHILDYAKAPSVMDYLSLDVEGAEFHVLKGFAFDKYIFQAVTIERPIHATHRALSSHGYHFVQQLSAWGECLYLHKSHPDFASYVASHYDPLRVPVWNNEQKEYILHTQKDGS